MSDSDKLDRTRVDQLGLTDSINDDDKFIVSQRVEDDSDGNEQNATNIANFRTICGHVAESDPVVNKMLEIHYQVPHDGFPGSIKPGFGIDMQGDGTLDNALYMNKNLVFCGDDLSAGWLYNEKTGQYYKPNNLDLPMGMSYLRTSVHDGIEPSRTVATQVLDEQTYLGADFDNDTWVNKSAKLGKYLGENGDLGIPNDKSYNGSNNVYAPFPEPIVEHVIEWTNIGLAVNQWYTTGFSGKNPFETIILCRVAARASVSTLDPERRSLTITFKTREKDKQIASGSNFYYFKATLGPNDTEATLMSDTGEKLGRIIVRDYDNIIWSENLDKIHHKSTGMIKNNNQGNDRLLAWQIGLKRAGASGPPGGSTASSEDTFVDITKFLNGILVVVGIKVEYGEQSTGFDKTYLHDFSSKDMVVNQATDLAIYNTLVRETEKSMERMDYLETLGKFPDIIFQKNRPARLVGANLANTEASNAWQNSDNNHNMRINLDLTSSPTEVWLNVAQWLGAAGGLTPPTLFEDSYGQIYDAATIINSDFAPPNGLGVILDQNSIFDDSSNPNYPVRGKSIYNDEQIQENLKIANQAFSGNITINSENFELKDRFVKCSTGGWKVEETGREVVMWPSEDDPEARERVKSITYKIKCPEANLPVFSKVKDMLTLKPAGNLNLGGVRIGANSGLTVDASGSLAFNAGSGLTIDPNTGVVSVTGGGGGASAMSDLTDVDLTGLANGKILKYNSVTHKWECAVETGGVTIDDTTTSPIKTWSSNKINSELGSKQGTLTAGTGISIVNNVISATGGGGASDLADLGDVDLTTPTDGQVLAYDAIARKWKNSDVSTQDVVAQKALFGNEITITDGVPNSYINEVVLEFRYTKSSTGGVVAFVPCSGVELYCQSSLKSLTFPQSLYKGTADFISGRIEEEAGAMTITTSTMNSTYTSVFAKAMTDTNFVNSVEAFFDADIYDYVPFTNFADMQDRTISAYYGDWNGTTRLWIVWKDTRYTTNSQMTTALASNPIHVIGELRTKQTYSVQGHPLQIDPVSSITMLTTSDGTLKVSYISNDAHSIIAEVQNQTEIEDLSGTSITSPQEGQVLVFKDQVWKNVNIPTPWKDTVGTLTAGQTSVTISDAGITANSTIEVFTNPELPYNSISATTGSVTVTFDAQSTDVAVKVRIT